MVRLCLVHLLRLYISIVIYLVSCHSKDGFKGLFLLTTSWINPVGVFIYQPACSQRRYQTLLISLHQALHSCVLPQSTVITTINIYANAVSIPFLYSQRQVVSSCWDRVQFNSVNCDIHFFNGSCSVLLTSFWGWFSARTSSMLRTMHWQFAVYLQESGWLGAQVDRTLSSAK